MAAATKTEEGAKGAAVPANTAAPAGTVSAAAAPVENTDDKWKSADNVGKPDIDGWYDPGISLMKKQRLEGRIVGYTAFKNTLGPGVSEILIIKLAKPITVTVKNGGEEIDVGGGETKRVLNLEPGKNVALRISAALTDLLDYAEHKGEVLVIPSRKESIGGGQKMWKFATVKALGRKGERPSPHVRESEAATKPPETDDDIPF